MSNNSIKYFLLSVFASFALFPFSVLAALVDTSSYNSTTGTYNVGGQTYVVGPNGTIIQPVAPLGTASPSQPNTDCRKPNNLPELFSYAFCVLTGYVIPFLVVLGGVIFMTGVVKYVTAGDNEEKRQAGRGIMIFGIIALFVLISVWGFVKILTQSFFGTDPQFSSLPKQSTTVFEQ